MHSIWMKDYYVSVEDELPDSLYNKGITVCIGFFFLNKYYVILPSLRFQKAIRFNFYKVKLKKLA